MEKKKVLIITYYWPPAGGPGVQRVLKFVKYLPEFGWEPIVLTVANGEYPAIDYSLEKDIPEGTKVYKTKTIEPFRIFKFLSGKKKKEAISPYELVNTPESILKKFFHFIRNNFFIPDARIGFYIFGRYKLDKILKEESISYVFISSPPHSSQLFGLYLKRKKTNIKVISDFRDPWSKAFWEQSDLRLGIVSSMIKKIELKVLSEVDCLTTVSKGLSRDFSELTKNHSEILYNGYDPDDFKITKKPKNIFWIRFIGTLGDSHIPINFLNCFLDINFKNSLNHLKIEFVGNITTSLNEFIKERRLSDIIKISDYVSHDIAIDKIVNSEILLLFIAEKSTKGVLSGKLFEYMASGNFILVFTRSYDEELLEIISEYGNGCVVNFDQEISEVILGEYKKWINNETEKTPGNYIKYSRKNITQKLVKTLETL